MCTLALYFKMMEGYPLFAAANRDEHYDRPSSPPALLDTGPSIMAGRDLRAGGTWLGVNEHGLLVGILNRRSNVEQEPEPGIRSRGLLCLDLLSLKSAADARAHVKSHRMKYQPFTLVCADDAAAWVAYNNRDKIKVRELKPGLHVFTSTAGPDRGFEKIERVYKRFFQISEALDKSPGHPADWLPRVQAVLSDHYLGGNVRDWRDAICVHGDIAGTVSSSVIAYASSERRFRTYFCPGAPCKNRFSEAPQLLVR